MAAPDTNGSGPRWQIDPPISRQIIKFDLINVALATVVVFLVIQAFHFIGLIQSVLVLLILAVILATAIEPLVIYLRRFGLRRGIGVLVIYLMLVLILGIFLFFAIQIIAAQLAALLLALPTLTRQLATVIGGLPRGPIRDAANALLIEATSGQVFQGVTSILNTGTLSGLVFATLTLVDSLFAIVTVFVIAYFWVAERLVIRRLVLRVVQPDYRERALSVWEVVEDKLGAWARGQFILMVAVGVMMGIGYSVLGVQFALLLAVYAAIAEIIPMVGPYLGAAPAVLVALTQSPKLALFVVILTVLVNLVESNILIPRIMEQAVGLSPLTVILALLAGAAIYGVVGALLAVPIAAAIQAAVTQLTASSSVPPSSVPPPSKVVGSPPPPG